MAHYVIGDVQGCFKELSLLLKKIKFDKKKDKIIFAGDLVNRGDDSQAVLDFCLENKPSVRSVLGNHDFYLLYLLEHKKRNKLLKNILNSKNSNNYKKWLLNCPLMIKIKLKNSNNEFFISHAGIPYMWSLKKAFKLSREIELSLKNDAFNLLKNIWGDTPKKWKNSLKGYSRQRTIINYLTRMRFLGDDGSLKLASKKNAGKKGEVPWYSQTKDNLKKNQYIVFGHWAALEGKTNLQNIIGVDTGCVWGNRLTALRLEDKKIFNVKKL